MNMRELFRLNYESGEVSLTHDGAKFKVFVYDSWAGGYFISFRDEEEGIRRLRHELSIRGQKADFAEVVEGLVRIGIERIKEDEKTAQRLAEMRLYTR